MINRLLYNLNKSWNTVNFKYFSLIQLTFWFNEKLIMANNMITFFIKYELIISYISLKLYYIYYSIYTSLKYYILNLTGHY